MMYYFFEVVETKKIMTNFFKYIGVFLLSVGSAFAVGGLLVSAKNSLRHSLFSTSFLVFSGLVFILMGLVFIAQQLLDSNIEKNKYSLGDYADIHRCMSFGAFLCSR